MNGAANTVYLLSLLFGLTVFLPNLHAGLTTNVVTQFYEIEGTTARELRDQIEKKRPDILAARGAQGYTQWQLNWSANYQRIRGGCRIRSFDASVNIRIYLPKWKRPENSEDLPGELVKSWDAYILALTKHEQNHRDIAIEALGELRDRASKLKGKTSCEKMQMAMDDIMQEVAAKYRAKDAEYDRVTRHGVAEGVLLPYDPRDRLRRGPPGKGGLKGPKRPPRNRGK